ncbi:MAG: hypothetical protein QXF12_07140 [Candidatus Aenigmatarchaeota archaeon]
MARTKRKKIVKKVRTYYIKDPRDSKIELRKSLDEIVSKALQSGLEIKVMKKSRRKLG